MESFISSSEQCDITEGVSKVANSIEGNNFECVIRLLSWLNINIKYPQPSSINKNDIFRKRTASQIIEDGFATGCTDFTLAFISLARAKGIPTKYVEVISKDYFDDSDSSKVRGHVFAECFIKNDWYGVDPMGGHLKFNVKYPGYVIYAKGLDSWDLGIRDLDSMRKKFQPFSKEYKAKLKK